MPRLRPLLILGSLLSGLFFPSALLAQQDQTIEQYQAAAAAYQSGNFAAAEKLWTTLANQGNANAQYAIGIMHLKKEIPGARDQIAFRYLIDAAKGGHVAAMFNLGVAYWEGRGTQRQPAKAANWWELAAEQQDAGAQYNLGLAYYLGEGRKQDANKAKYWLDQAIKNGHPQAKPLLDQIASVEKPAKSEARAPKQAPAKPAVATATAKSTLPGNSEPAAKKKKATPPEQSPKIVATTDSTMTADKADMIPGQSSLMIAIESTLKAAPNDSAATMISLPAGTEFKLVKRGQRWSKIRITKPFPVWVYETLLNDLGNNKGEIKGNNVNIRPTPSTDKISSPALGQLNEGEIVTIRSRRGPWVEILSAEAFPGWIQNDAITTR